MRRKSHGALRRVFRQMIAAHKKAFSLSERQDAYRRRARRREPVRKGTAQRADLPVYRNRPAAFCRKQRAAGQLWFSAVKQLFIKAGTLERKAEDHPKYKAGDQLA